MQRLVWVGVVLQLGCATVHERAGDRARAAGDSPTAIREYESALRTDGPLMDYEYERIRDKRRVLVEGRWGPELDVLVGPAAERDGLVHCEQLLTFRRRARDAGPTAALASRLERVVTEECTAARPEPALPSAAPEATTKTLHLLDVAWTTFAPQPVLDAVLVTLEKALARPWPVVGRGKGLDAMRALLTVKRTLRNQRVPARFEAALDQPLLLAAQAGVEPNGRSPTEHFAATLTLRTDATRLAVSPAVLQALEPAHRAATDVLVAEARATPAARALETSSRLAPLTATLEEGHPLRAAHAEVLARGVAHHQAQAAAHEGFAKLFHLLAAANLGKEHRPAAEAAREALGDQWQTSLSFTAARAQVEAACEGSLPLVTRAMAGTARRTLAAQVDLSRCTVTPSERTESRSVSYRTEETFQETVRVQVGVRSEQVQVGTRDEQCTSGSSVPGTYWQGVCKVPVYETKVYPVYEDRQVTKVRAVDRTQFYSVRVVRLTAQVSGAARVSWDDGTTLVVPFTATDSDEAEAFSYQIPGPTLGSTPISSSQVIPASFRGENTLQRASSQAGSEAVRALTARVRAHRAALARADGVKAGDVAGALDAFVTSVLLDGAVEAEAASFFSQQHGLPPARATRLLTNREALETVPAAVAPVRAEPNPLTALQARKDPSGTPFEVNVDALESYGDARPPTEFFAFHVGVVPWEIQTGPAIAQGAIALPIAFDLHFHPMGFLNLRYGLVLHDDVGVRFTLGVLTGGTRRDYTMAPREPGTAVSIEGSYAAYVGLRVPYFAVFGGLQVGAQHAALGHTWAPGAHLEPAVRLALRLFGVEQLIIEGTGLVSLVPGIARKDRLMVSFPLKFLKDFPFDLRLSVERTLFEGSALSADGLSRQPIGPVPFQMAGAQLGARF